MKQRLFQLIVMVLVLLLISCPNPSEPSKNNNSRLSTFSLNVEGTDYPITPAFSPEIQSYNVTIPNGTTGASLSLAVDHDLARPTLITGVNSNNEILFITASEDAQNYSVTNLSSGENRFQAQITAENGSSTIYTLIVQVARDTDSSLASFSINAGGRNYPITPSFSPEILSYTVEIPADYPTVQLSFDVASLTAQDSVITGRNSINQALTITTIESGIEVSGLSFGTNTLQAQITAEDGSETNYDLTITVPQSSNTKISQFSAQAGLTSLPLSRPFHPEVRHHEIILPARASTIRLNTTLQSPTAQIVRSGLVGTAGDDTTSLTLSLEGTGGIQVSGLIPGTNTITIPIQAQDGTTDSYTISIVINPHTNSELRTLSVRSGGSDRAISPEFLASRHNYTVSLPANTTTATVNLTLADSYASIPLANVSGTSFGGTTALGVAETSTGVYTISQLTSSYNNLSFIVQAEDGSTTTYNLGLYVSPVIHRSKVEDRQNGQYELDGARRLDVATINSTQYLFVASWRDDGVSVFEIGANGALTHRARATNNGGVELYGASNVKVHTIGTKNYLFASGFRDNGISIYEIGVSGSNVTLTHRARADNRTASNYYMRNIQEFDLIDSNGKTYLVTASPNDHGISLFEITVNGNNVGIVYKNHVRDSNSIALRGAYGVETVTVGGKAFAIVNGFYDDGVSVFEIVVSGSNATLTHRSTINSAGNNALVDPFGMSSTVINGKTYILIAAYGSDGFTVFELSNTGALTRRAYVRDNFNSRQFLLNGAVGITTRNVGGRQLVFVASFEDDAMDIYQMNVNGNTVRLVRFGGIVDRSSSAHELDYAHDVITAVVNGTTYAYVAAAVDDGISVIEIVP